VKASYVNIKKSLNLRLRKVEGSFVVRASSIHHHPMQSAALADNIFDRSLHAIFFRNVRGDSEDAPWKLFLDNLKLIPGFCYINRVDFGGTVGKTTFSNSKADATICTGN